MIFLSGFISILLLLASYVHAFAPTNSAIPRHSPLTKIRSLTTIARPTSFLLVSNTEQLNIAFVTGNQMKVREIELILSENKMENLVNLRVIQVDLPEIQEVNTEGIAKEKALLAAQLAGGSSLIEDTSLEFHALGGMPGPYIKWFQERLKSVGLWRILTAYEDKSATAVCTLAFSIAPHADPVLFTGKVEGTIVEPVEGRGFGWDSIFVPRGEDQPFSCLSIERKNELSHRGNAVRQWIEWLKLNKDELIERQKTGKQTIGHKGLDFKSNSPEQ